MVDNMRQSSSDRRLALKLRALAADPRPDKSDSVSKKERQSFEKKDDEESDLAAIADILRQEHGADMFTSRQQKEVDKANKFLDKQNSHLDKIHAGFADGDEKTDEFPKFDIAMCKELEKVKSSDAIDSDPIELPGRGGGLVIQAEIQKRVELKRFQKKRRHENEKPQDET